MAEQTLTGAQKTLIAQRQRTVRQRLHGFFLHDTRYHFLTAGRSRRSLGGAINDRMTGFAKAATFNDGRLLLTYWTQIEAELNRDPYILGARLLKENRVSQFAGVAWDTHFYQMAEGEEGSIDEGKLMPKRVTGMPGFGIVSIEQAQQFLGYWGGADTTAAHPIDPPQPTPAPTPDPAQPPPDPPPEENGQ